MLEGIVGVVAIIVGVIASLLFYFLPGIIASARDHNNKLPIWILTLLTGWSTIGWIIALIWSLTDNTKSKYPIAY